jgi:hypothetical protein
MIAPRDASGALDSKEPLGGLASETDLREWLRCDTGHCPAPPAPPRSTLLRRKRRRQCLGYKFFEGRSSKGKNHSSTGRGRLAAEFCRNEFPVFTESASADVGLVDR